MTRLMKEGRIHEALETLSQAAEEKKDELVERIESDYSSLKTLFSGAQKAATENAGRAIRRGKQTLIRTAENVDGRAHETPWKFIGASSAACLLLGIWIGAKKRS